MPVHAGRAKYRGLQSFPLETKFVFLENGFDRGRSIIKGVLIFTGPLDCIISNNLCVYGGALRRSQKGVIKGGSIKSATAYRMHAF